MYVGSSYHHSEPTAARAWPLPVTLRHASRPPRPPPAQASPPPPIRPSDACGCTPSCSPCTARRASAPERLGRRQRRLRGQHERLGYPRRRRQKHRHTRREECRYEQLRRRRERREQVATVSAASSNHQGIQQHIRLTPAALRARHDLFEVSLSSHTAQARAMLSHSLPLPAHPPTRSIVAVIIALIPRPNPALTLLRLQERKPTVSSFGHKRRQHLAYDTHAPYQSKLAIELTVTR